MTSAPPYVATRGAALRAPLAVAGATLAATAYVGTVDPGEAGHYPVCPFLALTGLYCPFCGSLRAVHALAHGDLPAAAGRNVLTVVGLAVLVVLWVGWVARRAGVRAVELAAPRWLWPGVLTVTVVFAVVRNLPFGSSLAP